VGGDDDLSRGGIFRTEGGGRSKKSLELKAVNYRKGARGEFRIILRRIFNQEKNQRGRGHSRWNNFRTEVHPEGENLEEDPATTKRSPQEGSTAKKTQPPMGPREKTARKTLEKRHTREKNYGLETIEHQKEAV